MDEEKEMKNNSKRRNKDAKLKPVFYLFVFLHRPYGAELWSRMPWDIIYAESGSIFELSSKDQCYINT